MFNCLFKKKNKIINQKKDDLSKINNETLNILLDSCVNLYDPINNNYQEIKVKFNAECIKIFNDKKNYIKSNNILSAKMLEKKNNIKFYCVYMTLFETIKIIEINNQLKFINYDQNVLYYLEYLHKNKYLIDEVVNKYKKIYNCEITVC
jgi:hypothetical protein